MKIGRFNYPHYFLFLFVVCYFFLFFIKFPMFNIYYQNVRGLRTKTNDFYKNVQCCNFDIIILTETWLNDSVINAEIFDNRYNVHRRDRGVTAYSKKKEGGGVIIAVLKKYNSSRISFWESNCEDLWVTIDVNLSNTIKQISLCAVYLPPPVSRVLLDNFLDNCNNVMNQRSVESVYYILGDFNLSCLNWRLVGDSSYVVPGVAQSLVDFCSSCGLEQCNYVVNGSNKVLDLVLTNASNCRVVYSADCLSKLDPYHPPIEIALLPYACNETLEENPSQRRRNFYKSDYDAIKTYLGTIEWDELFANCNSVDAMLDIFYSELHKAIDKFVPFHVPKSKKYPPWFSLNLIKRLKEKNKLRLKLRKYNNPMDGISLKLLSKRCEKLALSCHNFYINHIECSIKSNPKIFWNHVKNKRGGKSTYPSSMLDGDTNNTVSDGGNISNMFATFFASVHTADPPSGNNTFELTARTKYDLNNDSLSKIELDKVTLLKYLKSLDSSKGAGADGIPPFFIRECASYLATPLLIIYNESLKTGFFPTQWKAAKVVPIFKGNDNKIVSNYRPISILCSFAKTLEALISPILQNFFKKITTDHQHGFLRSRSTTTNLATFVEKLVVALDAGSQVDVIYTDFSKAFDRVPHKLLISKLSSYGVAGPMLGWCLSYLSNRSFYVVVNGYKSSSLKIRSGVPQGSHLGPIFFSIFINDIPTILSNSTPFLYADDLKITREIKCVADSEALQKDIDILHCWCKDNGMELNANKCFQISFSRKINLFVHQYSVDGTCLKSVNCIKDLGVTLDSKLTFTPHIDNTVLRASKTLGFVLRNTKDFKNPMTKKILYNSFVRSILEYGSIVWRPHYATHSLRLERVQKRFVGNLIFAAGAAKRLRSYNMRLRKLKMVSLETRRDLLDLTFLHKLFNNKIDCPQLLTMFKFTIPRRYPRNKIIALLSPPIRRTKLGHNSPVSRLSKLHNEFSSTVDIFSDSQTCLRRTILSKQTC